MNPWYCTPAFAALLSLSPMADAAPLPVEEEFYPITEIATPTDAVIEPGAIEVLPGGKLIVGTRRGQVWMVTGALATPPKPSWTLFAEGLHEILGIAIREEWIYVTHRPGVDRLRDRDGDGRADVFETVCDQWGIGGDYHEYAFGSGPDKEGNIWCVLCLTGSFTSNVPWRGWCVRISPQGELIPTCSGVRSPGGIGPNAVGDMFYTDNQGPWNGSSSLKWLKPGGFVGHPDGNRWYDRAAALGPKPVTPNSNSRLVVERERIAELIPPAVILPHGKLGQSASGIACDTTGGRFGPFQNQLFVGDQTFSNISRVFLEKVNGMYQGAAFPFRSDFLSGCVPLRFADDGTLVYGGTARGWGSRGGREFSLERVNWSGRVPFEIHEMRAKPDGFEFTFTRPADPKSLADRAGWSAKAYCYIYRADYGSPEVDTLEPKITGLEVASDGMSVRVRLDPLTKGHIHEFRLAGARDSDGRPLAHDLACYTLNEIPGVGR